MVDHVPPRACPMLDAALRYLSHGFSVIPLIPRSKKPFILWKPYQERRPTDAEVRTWWNQWPDANVGIVTGTISGGLVVVDVDGHDNLFRNDARLAGAPAVISGGGGRHFWFKTAPGVAITNSSSKLAACVDVRGEGGYIVAPPSIHENGSAYRFEPDREFTGALLDLPPDFVRVLASTTGTRTTPGRSQARSSAYETTTGGVISQGERNDALARIAGAMRRKGLSFDAIHAALREENRHLCSPPLADDEVEAIAKSISRYEPGDAGHERDIAAAKELVARIKESGNLNAVFDAADAFAKIPAAELAKIKADLKSFFGNRLNLNDFARALADSARNVAPAQAAGPLPSINYRDLPLRENTKAAVAALVAANEPPELFRQGISVVRVVKDAREAPMILPVDEDALRMRLARAADFFIINAQGKQRPVAPPIEIVRDILSLGEWPLPPLDGLTEVPIVRPDGSIVCVPGYDEASRLLYRAQPHVAIPQIPDAPTSAEVGAAIALLDDCLGDFPFAAASSRANALALIVTSVIRPMLSGCVPLALLDAPLQGTGKTLLTSAVAIIATGRGAAAMNAPRDDDEFDKRITAILAQGAGIVVIDNVTEKIESASLARCITASRWAGRILGRTEMLDLPARAVWIANGNNLTVGADLARRCFWIRLDPRVAKPWQRTGFRHPNLLAHIEENRGMLLAAVFTLVRAWVHAGRPAPTGLPVLGGFEEWCETVGGILEHANVHGFLGNLADLQTLKNPEDWEWEQFLLYFADFFNGQPFLVRAMANALNNDPYAQDLLPTALADDRLPQSSSLVRSLGRALGDREGRRYGDREVHVVRCGQQQRATLWMIVAQPPPQPPPASPTQPPSTPPTPAAGSVPPGVAP